MGCMQSSTTAAAAADGTTTKATPFPSKQQEQQQQQQRQDNQKEQPAVVSLAKPNTLTSLVFNDTTHPPVDWCDTAFLVPHEWLRREMAGLQASTAALPASTDAHNAWKADYFAQWIIKVFVVSFELHHANEDDIYIPMMKEQGCIDEKVFQKIGKDHAALVQQIHELQSLAETIHKAQGLHCATVIAQLKEKVPLFVKDMQEHLKEEETNLPAAIRAHVSKEAHTAAVGKIMQAAGFEGLQTEIPGCLVATQEWSTEDHYQHDFLPEIPPPILQLQQDICIPNYHSYYCALRDAPTLKEKPTLTQIPFDPSMLPPPPPAKS